MMTDKEKKELLKCFTILRVNNGFMIHPDHSANTGVYYIPDSTFVFRTKAELAQFILESCEDPKDAQ